MKPIRILVPGDSQSKEAISIAIAYADEICKQQQGGVQEAILFVPGKESVRSTTISAAIGDQNAKKLQDGGLVLLPTGTPLRLETIRTLRWVSKQSVLISIYSDQKMLDQVDSVENLVGIIAVPHIPDALKQWQRTWSPTVHGEATQSPIKLIQDPILEQALLALTQSVNLSHSTLHPTDKEHSDSTLRILRLHGHTDDPQNIRSWLIQNGWQPTTANELEKLAQKIFSLKSKPRLQNPEVAQSRYEYWRSKASAKSQ